MLCLLIYVFLYCNVDILIRNVDVFVCISYPYHQINNELIQSNHAFFFAVKHINLFALAIYVIYIIQHIVYYKTKNNTTMALAFVYIKYLMVILTSNSMTLEQYEFNRVLMWLFSTPLMLKMYCDVNGVDIYTIGIPYHLVPTLGNVILYPYKNTVFYQYISLGSFISVAYFIKRLHEYKKHLFTNIYLFVWYLFTLIVFAEFFQLTDKYNLYLYYLVADLVSKITINIIISDYEEKEHVLYNGMDLQSIQYVTYMIQHIQKYHMDHANITEQCRNFIHYTEHIFLSKVPENKTGLERELLKKILPLDFDRNYIENTNMVGKHFDLICVLFTDIVNYTELAKRYDDTIIFRLLHDIYNTFDNTIKKYPHLQKIETIGDAYMVVGDIYRIEHNYKQVIVEILKFAINIMQDIKKINTPDNTPLSIRIGINLGNVSVGILGNEIPRLCVVGNCVNVAARLQSTADKDTIQMSRHIYEHIEDIDLGMELEIIQKDGVFLKNIGSVTTYNIGPMYDE